MIQLLHAFTGKGLTPDIAVQDAQNRVNEWLIEHSWVDTYGRSIVQFHHGNFQALPDGEFLYVISAIGPNKETG